MECWYTMAVIFGDNLQCEWSLLHPIWYFVLTILWNLPRPHLGAPYIKQSHGLFASILIFMTFKGQPLACSSLLWGLTEISLVLMPPFCWVWSRNILYQSFKFLLFPKYMPVKRRFCFFEVFICFALVTTTPVKKGFSFVCMNCFSIILHQTKCCTNVMVQTCKHNEGDFWIVKDKLFSLWLWSLLALCAPADALLHYKCKSRSAALSLHWPHCENLRGCRLFMWQ